MYKRTLFLIATLVIGGAAVLATMVLAQTEPDSGPGTVPLRNDDDSSPEGGPQVVIPEAYRSSATAGSDSGTSVYFTPQDENTSTTVLFLYNTGGISATVGLQTFELDGTTYISTSLTVPPSHLVRVAGDTVSTIAGSWQDVVLVNFTTFSTYARMTVPTGVKVDGYVVWNGASNYDPLQEVPTLPLRFSTDPAAVFLPAVNRE